MNLKKVNRWVAREKKRILTEMSEWRCVPDEDVVVKMVKGQKVIALETELSWAHSVGTLLRKTFEASCVGVRGKKVEEVVDDYYSRRVNALWTLTRRGFEELSDGEWESVEDEELRLFGAEEVVVFNSWFCQFFGDHCEVGRYRIAEPPQWEELLVINLVDEKEEFCKKMWRGQMMSFRNWVGEFTKTQSQEDWWKKDEAALEKRWSLKLF